MLFFMTACKPVTTVRGILLKGYSLNESVISVSHSQIASGSSASITLTMNTKGGVKFISNKPSVSFSLTGGTSAGTLSAVINNGNGTYTATFLAITAGTPLTIKAFIDGSEVQTVSPSIQVTSGSYSLSNSLLSTAAGSVASASAVTVTLSVRDASNNPLSTGGLSVVFSHTGGTSSGVFGAVSDHHDGTYSAQFTGVTAGTATSIHATIAGGSVSSTSPTVTVTYGSAVKLEFSQEPTDANSGVSLSPAVTVSVKDINDNIVTGYSSNVVMGIELGFNPGGSTLSGSLTQVPVNGVATFPDLSLNYYENGYKLSATSGALSEASSLFDILPVALTHDWSFTSSTESQYEFSDPSVMEFINGSVSLKALTDRIEVDDEDTGTMTVGVRKGVEYGLLADGVTQGLKLGDDGICHGATSNCANVEAGDIYELNASWTPHYADILAYWQFDSTGTISNSDVVTAKIGPNGTAKNLNGTGMSYQEGKVKNAIQLDGTDDYVQVNLNSPETNYTYVVWFKTVAHNTALSSVRQPTQGGSNDRNFYISGREVCHRIYSEETICSTGNYYSDGNWHQAVVVVELGVGQRLYVDAKLVASGTRDFSHFTWDDSLDIGYNGNYTDGQLDEIALWNKVLTQDEIATIYSHQSVKFSGVYTSRIMDAGSNFSWDTFHWIPTLPFQKELPDANCSLGPTCIHQNSETSADYSMLVGSNGSINDDDLMDGIIGLWHLDEISGATAIKDFSGQGNDGTPFNLTSGVLGRLNKAASFNGTNGHIYLGAPASLTAVMPELSISVWYKKTTGDVYGQFIGRSFTTWELQYHGANRPNFYINSEEHIAYSTALPQDGEWHHLVVTFNDSLNTVSFYLDGAWKEDITTAESIPVSSNGVEIGKRYGSGEYFNGQMDEIGVWSRTLHASEIKQLYQRGASRLKYQVRTCASVDPTCAAAVWKGPDGSAHSYFSEINNNTTALDGSGFVKPSLPVMLFTDFTSPPGSNQYIQYRTIFESDIAQASLQPQLKSTSVGPVLYDANSPEIYGKNGIAFSELDDFTELLGAGGCSSGISYNLSLDKATWKYWDGDSWETAASLPNDSNDAVDVLSHVSSFNSEVGKGPVYVKAFLHSTGRSKCVLDNIHIGGQR